MKPQNLIKKCWLLAALQTIENLSNSEIAYYFSLLNTVWIAMRTCCLYLVLSHHWDTGTSRPIYFHAALVVLSECEALSLWWLTLKAHIGMIAACFPSRLHLPLTYKPWSPSISREGEAGVSDQQWGEKQSFAGAHLCSDDSAWRGMFLCNVPSLL